MKKIIVITGANRGLGKALVDHVLKDEESFVFSLSRSLHSDHKEVRNEKLVLLKTDLSEPFNEAIFDEIHRRISEDSVLYFFNNASVILPIERIGNFNQFDITSTIKVNVEYPVHFINSFLNIFSQNKKILINITSGAGNNSIPFWSLYGASKSYMKMFFNVLEDENKDNGNVESYSIDPGVLDTGMQENIRNNSFPSNDYFTSLKEDNKLIKPEVAAMRILNEINF